MNELKIFIDKNYPTNELIYDVIYKDHGKEYSSRAVPWNECCSTLLCVYDEYTKNYIRIIINNEEVVDFYNLKTNELIDLFKMFEKIYKIK